jgi:hypothetical protein
MEDKIEAEQCCVVSCDTVLGETYWNNQYNAHTTGWDMGQVSPPLKEYINQLINKELRILIPGCGNSYEADYLLHKGFTNITVIDIAPTLVGGLKTKYAGNKNINIVLGDFFTHSGIYDLIIEQTFFCAIDPSLRNGYVSKMNELLADKGKLTGVLFDKKFKHKGPPFGGCKCEYIPLFGKYFNLKTLEPCYNSFAKRSGTELFSIFLKHK